MNEGPRLFRVFLADRVITICLKKMDLSLILMEREDSWVMGKDSGGKTAMLGVNVAANGAVVSTVQRQVLSLYLDEYTRHWQDFLRNIRIKDDILPLNYGNASMFGDLYVLRTLAAPDSPLLNLVRRAVEETTLGVQPEKTVLGDVNKGRMLHTAMKVSMAYASLEKKLLWEKVDSHFAALCEFVTVNSQVMGSDRPAASNTRMNKLMGVLNEQC